MNERMKKITGQVLDELVPETWVALGYDKIKEIQYRTAELIVRECTLFVSKQNGPKSALNLLEHFGVEEQEKVASKPKCSVCGTTENVKYMGGYQPYLCDSVDCIPF